MLEEVLRDRHMPTLSERVADVTERVGASSQPHVRDRVDPNGVAEHTVREHEREAAHDATPHAVLGGNVRERRAGRRERGDELHGAFDGRVEALASAGPLLLVPIGGSIELGACSRRELDDFHDRF